MIIYAITSYTLIYSNGKSKTDNES